MASSMRLVSAVFVLVLLLVATEMGPMGVEGRNATPKKAFEGRSVTPKKKTCEGPSQKFKGMCFLTSNCAKACKSEGFSGGQCRGFIRKCICSKRC